MLDDPDRIWEKPAITALGRLDKQGTEGKRTVVGRSVRTERYRYTEWNEGREGRELYDHRSDPNEFTNLAGDPDQLATVLRLQRLLRQYSEAAQ